MTGKPLVLMMAWAICAPLLSNAGEEPRPGEYGFIENKGQIYDQYSKANPAVKYLLKTPGMNVQLRNGGFSYDAYVMDQNPNWKKQLRNMANGAPDATLRFHRVDITLEGANNNAAVVAEERAADYLNYYNPMGGFDEVHHYGKVTYQNIYSGIDLEFVTDKAKGVKYNFIVHPGADVSQIKMKYAGANSVSLNDGHIDLALAHGAMEEHIPASYTANTHKAVEVQYRAMGNNTFGYQAGSYDKTQTLIIDPTPDLRWATYYGGSGNDGNMYLSVSGNSIYTAGFSSSTTSIATAGAYQTTMNGMNDGIIAKFTTAGARQWATYYGGANNDIIQSLNVSNSGDLCVTGQTRSTSGIASLTAHQASHAGGTDPNDGFVAKFTSSGTLAWGTYYGGANSMEYIVGSTFDAAGNVFACGTTAVASGTSIATTTGFQNFFAGGNGDGFLVKFNSSGVRQWATYVGSNNLDEADAVAVDGSGNIFLCGTVNTQPTTSYLTSASPHQGNYGGGNFDYFLAKYDGATGGRYWSTYYGGLGDESRIAGRRVGVDVSGNVYLVGGTTSANAIATSTVMQPSHYAGEDGFIAMFNTNGGRIWGTYFGSTGEEAITAIVSDGSTSDMYVAGFSDSPTGLATQNGYQMVSGGGTLDMFFARTANNGWLRYSSFYGRGGDEETYTVATDATQHVYVAGATSSSTGMSSTGAHQAAYGGGQFDGFLAGFNACLSSVQVDGLVSFTNVSCYGLSDGSITVTPSGGTSPYMFKDAGSSNWQASNVFSGLPVGNYSIDIKDDHGCMNMMFVGAQINQPGPITATISGPLNTEKGNIEIYTTPTQSGISFQWSATGGTIQNGQGFNQATVLWNISGMQSVKVVTSSATCKDSANYIVNVKPPVSVNDAVRKDGIAMYPNPARELVHISLDGTPAADEMITVYNTVGRVVLQQPLRKEQDVNISQLAAGVYNISVGSWRGKVTKL